MAIPLQSLTELKSDEAVVSALPQLSYVASRLTRRQSGQKSYGQAKLSRPPAIYSEHTAVEYGDTYRMAFSAQDLETASQTLSSVSCSRLLAGLAEKRLD